jgi:hypothetical protein
MLQNPGVALDHDAEKWKTGFRTRSGSNEELALLPAALRDRRAGLLLPPHVHYLLPVNRVEPQVAITA